MASAAFRFTPVLTRVRARRTRILPLLAATSLLAACGGGRPAGLPAPAPVDPAGLGISPDLLLGEELRPVDREILGGVDFDLPIEANSWVQSELEYLVTERKDLIDSWINRGEQYRGFIQRVLREEGLPTDLYHLAMIESGFVPTARSHAGAAGMWQFMPATARDVGLRVDGAVDERLDPVRSTRAAARHLRSLFRIHEDWALAAAAYNAGSGRINRGLEEFSASDFWELAQRGDLAEETRQYVPRLYAVTILSRDRDRFGLRDPRATGPFAFDSIFVEYETPLSALATLGGASSDDLEALNPHLVQGTTPAGGYWVWVPAGSGPELQRAYLASSIRAEQGLGRYTVRWGDSLSRIAAITDLASSRIREMNPRIDFDRLMAGAEIRLPRAAVDALATRADEEPEPSGDSDAPVGQLVSASTVSPGPASGEHVVEQGESLWAIARRYDVSIEAIQEANGISGSTIVPGQRLRVPQTEGGASPEEDAAIEYVVESGDTLWDLARRYATTIEAIRDANGLGDRPIQPGQVLTVPR